jgi:hypothetical protein
MEVQFLDPEPPVKRTLKKIPGRQDDIHVIDHETLAKIINFERRDIVCDILHCFLKFMKEVNMMANFGGEYIDWDPSKDADTIDRIAPLPKDLHTRQIGIAFFALASNVVANWEQAYLKACIEFMKEQTAEDQKEESPPQAGTRENDTSDECQDLEERLQTFDQTSMPLPSQNGSKCFEDAWDDFHAQESS